MEYWKVKNIYDLAGNCFEWTNDMENDEHLIYGGCFGGYGGGDISFYYNSITSSPYSEPIDATTDYNSFRVQLYVK